MIFRKGGRRPCLNKFDYISVRPRLELFGE